MGTIERIFYIYSQLLGHDLFKKYCIYYYLAVLNFMQVKTTHYLRGTTHPQWESRVQFLVSDFTQVSLSFVVCSWSPNKIADTHLLGLAIFRMHQVLQRRIFYLQTKDIGLLFLNFVQICNFFSMVLVQ
jgi:hypothetical protein